MGERKRGRIPGLTSLTFEGEDADIPGGGPSRSGSRGRTMRICSQPRANCRTSWRPYDGVYQLRGRFSVPVRTSCGCGLKPEARALGITVAALARTINAGYYGAEPIRVQRGRDEVKVRVRYAAEERARQARLRADARAHAGGAFEVPLLSVAEIEKGRGFAGITRTNGQRRIAVSAEVNSSVTNTNEIVRDLKDELPGGIPAKLSRNPCRIPG